MEVTRIVHSGVFCRDRRGVVVDVRVFKFHSLGRWAAGSKGVEVKAVGNLV